MKQDREQPNLVAHPSSFATTCWSIVLNAGAADEANSAAALTTLFQTYWYPLYAYVRRRGVNSDEAQDIVQGFFVRLLEKGSLTTLTPERGRFRSFLLTAIKHFLINERHRAQAQKRGGKQRPLSLDFPSGESRLALMPVDSATPERIFDRQWALALLEIVMRKLEAEYRQQGRERQFEVLKEALVGSGQRIGYAKLGEPLGLSEAASRQTVGRMRKRYRELLREEVAATLANPGEIDDEIRELFRSLSGSP